MEKILYHGTWWLAYSHEGESKYSWTTREIQDRLWKILSQWLIPSYDPLNSRLSTTPELSKTISLTQKSPVAVLYATMFESELHKVWLSKIWRHYLFWKYIIETLIFSDDSHWKNFLNTWNLNEASINLNEASIWRWDSLKIQRSKWIIWVLNQFFWMAYFMSDIPENFPVVFEINGEGLSRVPMKWKINAFERRVWEKIPPERINKIYVPKSTIEIVWNRGDILSWDVQVQDISMLL